MTDQERNLAVLRKQFHDVKFDLEGTDYKALKTIGSGTYGVVCSALHCLTGKNVAIKKIPNIFENCVLAKRTLRELKILRHFDHENVVKIVDVLRLKHDEETFRDVYLVMDLMETDLYQIIRSKQVLTDDHIRYFVYQIACGLKYIHSANVMHRDLKPSNLLVNGNCLLKIADFGMARCVSSDEGDRSSLMTWYVATRWYRAPELMLFKQKYTGVVDIWSVGCILAELLGRQPIFPGRNFTNQLQLIFGILGSPNEDFVSLSHADRIKEFIRSFGVKDPVPLKVLYPNSHPKALRLLEKMLKLDPRERISAADILHDLYLNQYHDPSLEPVCLSPFNFDLDEQNLNSCLLRRCIYEEISRPNKKPEPSSASNFADRNSVIADSSEVQSSAGSCRREALIEPKLTKREDKSQNLYDRQVQNRDQGHKLSLNSGSKKNSESQDSCVAKNDRPDKEFQNTSLACDSYQMNVGKIQLPVKTSEKSVGALSESVLATISSIEQPSRLLPTAVTNIKSSTSLVNDTSHLKASSVNKNNVLQLSKPVSHRPLESRKEFGRNGVNKKTRKTKKQKAVKPVNPISLFNELGERINVKAVLKNSILNGYQPKKCTKNLTSGNQVVSKSKKTAEIDVQLSEEDRNLLRRWSQMQKPTRKTDLEAENKGNSKDSASAEQPVLPVMVLETCLSSPSDDVKTVNQSLISDSDAKCSSASLSAFSESLMQWSPSIQLTSGDIRSVLAEKIRTSVENSGTDNIGGFPMENFEICPVSRSESVFKDSSEHSLLCVNSKNCSDIKVPPTLADTSSNVAATSSENSVFDNLLPLYSSAGLRASGYGIEMDLETVFSKDMNNTVCEWELSSASILSGWMNEPITTPDPEEILSLISDM